MRGRVVVHWPLVGNYDVDLLTGELFVVPSYSGCVVSVDIETGRVVGQGGELRLSASLVDVALLQAPRVGDEVVLNSGTVAQVVDVLHSEGVVRLYVLPRKVWRERTQRLAYRVGAADLANLRQRAGCIAIAS